MNPHNVTICMRNKINIIVDLIYPKMSDQTVNSICAFIISNNDTDFLIKL